MAILNSTVVNGDLNVTGIAKQNGVELLTSHQDISGLLKLDGTNTMTGVLNLKASGNNETNIGTNGIRWNTDSLPQDTSPQFVCTIDAFASGGRQNWASIANLRSVLSIPDPTNYYWANIAISSSSSTTTNPTFSSCYATSFYATSDKRLKENIIDYKCNKSILDLPIKEFDYKENGEHTIGCIAQDLQEICPEIVKEREDGYLTIQENKLIYLLIQEVKELKEEVNKLKGE